MMRKITIFIMLFALTYCYSQQTISGRVVDALSSEPLSFTNIGVLGHSEGSISNDEGFFVLSIANVLPTDTILFSFVGYEPLKLPLSSLSTHDEVKLTKRAIQLSDISVLSREYTPIEILDLVKKNYSKNHPSTFMNQQVFSRDASYTTIHKSDMKYKKSSFEAIDQTFVDEINEKMPEQLNMFSDLLMDMYYGSSERKVVPVQGQALIENWNFNDEFSKRLDMLAGDFEDGMKNPDNYYKVRSGVFAGKIDLGNDTSFIMEEDSTTVTMSTSQLSGDVNYLKKTYSSIYSKRWDFVSDYKLYDYTLSDVSIINDELAYVITFKPRKRKGKFEGTICVATQSFALLQVDYAFAPDKEGRNISMLGVGYAVNERRGHVIYEKRGDGHYLKYLYRESNERFAMDRTLSLKQKENSGLFDKTIQEVKMKIDVDVTLVQKKELLVVSQQNIDKDGFDHVIQPDTYSLNKVKEYSSEMWKNTSIIEPNKALKEYTKQY